MSKPKEMQMNKARGFLLAAAAAVMGFAVSCTSDIETAEEFLAKQSSSSEGDSSPSVEPSSSSVSPGSSYAYCIKDGSCLEGPFTFSDCVSINGSPSNSCTVALSSSSFSSFSSSSVGLCANFVKGTKRLHYEKQKEQFCDERNGKEYVYVVIGTQTWMAENLNYNATGSKCYSNQESNCAKYGRLYNWSTALTACPPGWHLPTQAEWNTLSSYVQSNSGCSSCDARLLKATNGWYDNGNGTDQYGFSALPGGYGYSGGSFHDAGDGGYWWSASENSSIDAYYRGMYYDYEDANWYGYLKSDLFSVRCLKD